ncbi:MAG TPA: carboxymuconolactone decarboxylase family protein [Actinomycetota bacterium]|jgi:alkylhydroperoxidase/carboxymuconolactone decarboxylase family protein YurZ
MDAGEKLLRLLLHDEPCIEAMLGSDQDNLELSGLDARTHAITRLAALLALDAPSVVYQWSVEQAFAAGVTREEIVGCLIAAAPLIGIPRAVAAAPHLAAMIGYDLDRALESPT